MLEGRIHKSSVIGSQVFIDEDVNIGPFCLIDGNVRIGRGTTVASHVVIIGNVEIGHDCKIFPFSTIGTSPQDLKYKGEETFIKIGNRNIIRENVTINLGTQSGGCVTHIGDDNLLMIGSHIAHDVQIGSNCVIVNNVPIAGHAKIDDYAIVGGNSAVKQFVKIGKHSMVGGMSGVVNDIPPFTMAVSSESRSASIVGLNITGLKRRGFSRNDIATISNVYKILYSNDGSFDARILRIESEFSDSLIAQDIVLFCKNLSKHGLTSWNHLESNSEIGFF